MLIVLPTRPAANSSGVIAGPRSNTRRGEERSGGTVSGGCSTLGTVSISSHNSPLVVLAWTILQSPAAFNHLSASTGSENLPPRKALRGLGALYETWACSPPR